MKKIRHLENNIKKFLFASIQKLSTIISLFTVYLDLIIFSGLQGCGLVQAL